MPFDFAPQPQPQRQPQHQPQSQDIVSAEILARAAQIIKDRGWVQHTSVTKRGQVCASQAIFVASQEYVRQHRSSPLEVLFRGQQKIEVEKAWRTACRMLLAYIGDPLLDCVPYWNDAPGRRKHEVVDALARASMWLAARRKYLSADT